MLTCGPGMFVRHAASQILQASIPKPKLAFHTQVFGVIMHLKHAAAARVDAGEDMNSKAQIAVDKLTELCKAAEAVSDTVLLQLGLPVMRSVHG